MTVSRSRRVRYFAGSTITPARPEVQIKKGTTLPIDPVSPSTDLPRRHAAWLRYGVAVLCVAFGMAIRHSLTPLLGPTAVPFILFFPMLAVAAWFGGFGPGLVAAVLSGIIAYRFYFDPAPEFRAPEYWAFAAFAVSSLVIVSAMELMHRAKSDLIRSRDVLFTTLASIGDGVIVTDARGHVSFLNSEAERLTKWKSADAAGRPLAEVFRIVNEQTRRTVDSPVEKVLREGTTVGLANHTLLIAKDGSEIPIDDSGAPIREPGEPIVGVVLVFRDSSDQRKSYEAQARLATIVESSGDVILSKDLEGRILTWNRGAERLFGYTAAEMIGQSALTLIPPELHGQEAEILERIRQGRPFERLETVRLTRDGRRIPVALSVSPIKDREGNVIGAAKIIHDIADIVAAREALAREKELLRATLASIGDGVIVTDVGGRISFLNKEAERLTGWTTADARGKALPEVFKIINEDTRAVVENPVDKVLRFGTIVGLANHTILIARDGRETPIDDSAAPIQDSGGPVHGVVLVFRDFTEQKRAEEEIRQLNASLERSVARRTEQLQETVQELETFSYTVAHDLRAPLRTMHRSAEVLLLEQAPRLSDEGGDFLRRIAESSGRMDQLIQDLLAYSRVTRSELRSVPVAPRTILSDLVAQMSPEIRERQAEIEIDETLPPVLADPVLLSQVFTNLLSNAMKFVPEGTAPRVRVHAQRVNGLQRIWVEDNGIGIDPRYRERLFRLFERLDSTYPGTGIGLAIVKRAVERMGGAVGFEVGKDAGSRFWIELPPAAVNDG
jgi:PAS domain S-box-containing protein